MDMLYDRYGSSPSSWVTYASSDLQLTGRVDVASTPTQCTVKRPGMEAICWIFKKCKVNYKVTIQMRMVYNMISYIYIIIILYIEYWCTDIDNSSTYTKSAVVWLRRCGSSLWSWASATCWTSSSLRIRKVPRRFGRRWDGRCVW